MGVVEVVFFYILGLASPISIALINVGLVGLTLFFIARMVTGRWKPSRSAWLLIAFLTWNALCILTSPYPQTAAGGILKFWSWTAFFTATALPAAVRKHLRGFSIMLAFGAGVSAAAALIEFLTKYDWPEKVRHPHWMFGTVPASGFFSQHLTYGGVIIMVGLFLAARAVYGKSRRPWLWWAASAAAGIGLAASMARTYFVAVFPSMAVLLWKRGKKLVFTALLVLLLGVAVFAFWGPRGIKTRLQGTVNFHNPSIAQRLYLWQSGWYMWEAHPLFGWGPGTYPEASTPYKKPFEKRLSPRYQVSFMTLKHAHNLYLMMAIQSGLPGLLLFLLFIASVVDAIRRNPDPVIRWGVMAALTAFLFGGLFEYNGGDAEVATFIFFLMGLAASYAPSKPEETSG